VTHGHRAPLLPRRPLGPFAGGAGGHQPVGRLAGRPDVAGRTRAGGGGDRRRRGGRRHDASAAGVRARGHPLGCVGRPGAPPRRDWPGPRRRSRKADPGRARRGGPRGGNPAGVGRRGAPARRRGDSAGPRAAREGPPRHPPPVPAGPGGGDLSLQLPAQPVGTQARAGGRRRRSRRAEARHEDAADGTAPGERVRGSRPAGRRGQRPAGVGANSATGWSRTSGSSS